MTTTEVAREARTADVLERPTSTWYKDAVIYEAHVRAFRDGNGDGVGDFIGLIEKLDYLDDLGVNAIWLLPFYPSPLRDDGYDISDYRQVHPSYGTLRDFRLFLREAHRRGIRVITELVLAHTSDAHPWFQRARRARPGSSHRNFYVWSDTPDRYAEARVIFKDFEASNWTFDPVAGAYFWHRFYSHQPSLNYDNPAVRQAVFDVVDFWLSMGVDGLRLDAVPYLYAREGTTCENLPETFEFLRELRTHVDRRFEDRMLLAEANQWPEDAVRYMGDGDMCQMAFHFPLMPRMFMAARQEDRFPMVDILSEIPPTPPDGQWALFLRNHDELTLEMVTDEERDYMYRVYAQDPQARVNVGIRRRLAPLLGNDRKLIEMMNGLLFSMPGTPIVYYGDEIGMGDNIYLGDRNSVRTPMQWNGDRNAGFSDANPQRLYLPVIIDPEYHSQAVNVEAQAQNPNSLLWWMKRLVALRQRYQAFGRGSLEILYPENRKVFAFIRQHGDERILCVFNLSRHVQCAQLDLSSLRGAVPIELSGTQEFPPIGELPYFITLGPYGFYWFLLECEPEDVSPQRPAFVVGERWDAVFEGTNRQRLEAWLPLYLKDRRWFAQKVRNVTTATIVDSVPVPALSIPARAGQGTGPPAPVAHVLVVQIEFDLGSPERYLVPLAYMTGNDAEDMRKWHADAVVADVRAGETDGVLADAVHSHDFVAAVTDLLARRRVLGGPRGQLIGLPEPALRQFETCVGPDCPTTPMAAEQSNTSVLLDEHAILKFIRRHEEGVNPAVEVGHYLSEVAHFRHAPRLGGSVEYRARRPAASPATVAVLEEFVPNEGDGWRYVVDALTLGLEDALATPEQDGPEATPRGVVADESWAFTPAHPLVGPHMEWASLLGTRTAELHVALASATDNPSFNPEPLTTQDRVALFHGARRLARQVFADVVARGISSEAVRCVLQREEEIIERLRQLSAASVQAYRIRCHGDLHLGQVLWTGKDFFIIDFEGEPSRSLGWRRLKRPAAFDLAGMIRSFHYAGQAAALRVSLEFGKTVDAGLHDKYEDWLAFWHRRVSGRFLDSYLEVSAQSPFLPSTRGQVLELLDFFRLEKALYELSYEVNSRPTWVDIPARGIADILDSEP
ncbi:MAG TPA: maltose alpha-D-glucosyltransferase [Acidimicrobiales bacterium]|nr:maltose alpha-D-glucosyltransferase [Acidimicrobiales bacterium]